MRFSTNRVPSHVPDAVTGQTTFIDTWYLRDEDGNLTLTVNRDGSGIVTLIAAGDITDGSGNTLSTVAGADVWKYKGAVDCSGNPNYPAGDAGDLYRVSVAGKIGGASGTAVSVNDIYVCNADGTTTGTEAQKGTKWDHFPALADIAAVISDTAYNATSWDSVTTIAPSKNAVRDKIETLQASLLGTFSLANFTDPGDATASAALVGTIGTFVFGYVTYTPDVTTAQLQTFAVETAIASGSYTTVQVVGQANNAGNVGGASTKAFNFFVPTGRKWKHTATGTAAVTSLSGIAI